MHVVHSVFSMIRAYGQSVVYLCSLASAELAQYIPIAQVDMLYTPPGFVGPTLCCARYSVLRGTIPLIPFEGSEGFSLRSNR